MQLIDTHRHLIPSPPLSNTPSIVVSTSPTDWQDVIDNCQSNSHFYPSLGIHPWFVDGVSDADILRLKALIESTQLVAIGEVGLDKYGDYAHTFSLQNQVFVKMMELAKQYELPLSIHCRKAYNELHSHLRNTQLKGILHGFSGSYEQASEFIKLGYKIGVNGLVCNKAATRYRLMLKKLPMESLVLETDFPNVLDKSKRPIELQQVLACLSDLKDCSSEMLAEITNQNAMEIFEI